MLTQRNILKDFGKQVRRGRFEKNEMTMDILGKKVGVSRQTIAMIEAGEIDTAFSNAVAIAQELDISLDQLK